MSSKRIVVMPIMYRDCNLPLFLADRKYADFRKEYNNGFTDLCHALGIKHADTLTISNWRTFINERNSNWKQYREAEFSNLVTALVDRAKEYNWSCWTGGAKNPFSITLSAFISQGQRKSISIRLVKGRYMAANCLDINPNRTRASEYNIYVGNTINECEEYAWRIMEEFRYKYGNPQDKPHYFTERFYSDTRKHELAQTIINNSLKYLDWYQHKTV